MSANAAVPGGIGRPRVTPGAAAPSPARAELRRLASQLQSVFLDQLFQAMRASVPPAGDAAAPGGGEELFTSLLDEQVARLAAPRFARGPAEALYRQLERRLPAEAPALTPTDAAPAPRIHPEAP